VRQEDIPGVSFVGGERDHITAAYGLAPVVEMREMPIERPGGSAFAVISDCPVGQVEFFCLFGFQALFFCLGKKWAKVFRTESAMASRAYLRGISLLRYGY
jgi:hypothetical protein